MGKLSELPNIGKEVEKQLIEVGITTYEQLKETGAEKAWLKIQTIDKSACIHRLLALEGAIQEVKKTMLPDERKKELIFDALMRRLEYNYGKCKCFRSRKLGLRSCFTS